MKNVDSAKKSRVKATNSGSSPADDTALGSHEPAKPDKSRHGKEGKTFMLIKVAVVEDKAGIRENWKKLLEASPGFSCVAACESGETALEALPRSQPDVVLMDIHLPGISGIETILRLKQILPGTHFLVVTVYTDADRVFEALKAGASGYLLKSAPPGELLASITNVTQGQAPMNGEIARLVIEAFRQPAPRAPADAGLTDREEECLRLLSRGLANKEIAEHMGVSVSTVHFHLKGIYQKLHVRSRAEATLRYLQNSPTTWQRTVRPPAKYSQFG